jgi:Zn-finger nucleic acid-binding protein
MRQKCTSQMVETTFGRNMLTHQCIACEGLWFDLGEAKRLKSKWMP